MNVGFSQTQLFLFFFISFTNSVYDPSFEMRGLPLDPHLRLFFYNNPPPNPTPEQPVWYFSFSILFYYINALTHTCTHVWDFLHEYAATQTLFMIHPSRSVDYTWTPTWGVLPWKWQKRMVVSFFFHCSWFCFIITQTCFRFLLRMLMCICSSCFRQWW